MSQLLSTLDIALLQENAGVILSLMQQAGFKHINNVSFVVNALDQPFLRLHEATSPISRYTCAELYKFFREKLRISIELSEVDTLNQYSAFKILSAEVSQVKITVTYDICTVQSVLAAAVKEHDEVSVSESGTEVIDNGIVISMPDDDVIEDATAQIAYERFDDDPYDTSVSKVSRSSVEKRWVK